MLWPVAAIVRKHYGKPLNYAPEANRRRLFVRLVCVLFLVFYIGWVIMLSLLNDLSSINRLPPWIIILGILGVISAIGTIFVCLNAFRSVREPGRWLWTKLHDLALALACLGLIWLAFAWHLMSFNVHY